MHTTRLKRCDALRLARKMARGMPKVLRLAKEDENHLVVRRLSGKTTCEAATPLEQSNITTWNLC